MHMFVFLNEFAMFVSCKPNVYLIAIPLPFVPLVLPISVLLGGLTLFFPLINSALETKKNFC